MLTQIGMIGFGLCSGAVIASGVVAFIISLGIVPRYAGITRTAGKIMLYENCSMAGAVVGSAVAIFDIGVPLGTFGLLLYGSFAGIFLGSWIVALGEIVNLYAILARRIGLTRGIPWVILSMAAGKMIGSLIFFYKGW